MIGSSEDVDNFSRSCQHQKELSKEKKNLKKVTTFSLALVCESIENGDVGDIFLLMCGGGVVLLNSSLKRWLIRVHSAFCRTCLFTLLLRVGRVCTVQSI